VASRCGSRSPSGGADIIVTRARAVGVGADDVWPFTVPPVRQLVRGGLSFSRPVTFLVGENGSGKSTIVEGLAEAYGIDVRGGHGARRYASNLAKGPLGACLRLDMAPGGRTMRGARRARGFFLRAETAFGVFEHMSALSFTSCLRLLATPDALADAGGQVVRATHSPLLAALPGATLLELGDFGMRPTTWDELELVAHWRRFLERPGLYLRP
jgi:predicted ATPase